MSTAHYGFKAVKRERAGKGSARAARRAGFVPAVIYGDKKEPVSINIPSNDINVEYLKGHMYTSLCDMEVDGENHLLLARDVQLDPVSDVVIHADFLRVTPQTKIAVYVPVHFVGQEKSPGLKAGGILEVIRHEVELMCSAMDIPEFIEANLEGKEIGDGLRINDATLPAGVTPVIKRNFVLANLAAPRTAAEEEAMEAAADAAAAALAEAAAAENAAAVAAENKDKKKDD